MSPSHDYCVVLDACVLIPTPLCDTLLRAAEEPCSFRIAWSEQILDKIHKALSSPGSAYSATQASRRIQSMQAAFPEALHRAPKALINGIVGLPNADDRHVFGLAIHAHANTIVTHNLRDFPLEVLAPHHVAVESADSFLQHQYHLEPQSVLEKLDRQAAAIHKQRSEVLALLRRWTPGFCDLCSGRKA